MHQVILLQLSSINNIYNNFKNFVCQTVKASFVKVLYVKIK